ncbi:MAG: hypothetical protein IJX90_09780, partial [Blautia sp.]|nr:hypothetical protein [Blautia sp.]
MNTKLEELLTNTPYDDVFRTLVNDCRELLLPLLNEVFGEHYTGDEQVILSANEHFLNKTDGQEDKRVTDTTFLVVGKDGTRRYHWECQAVSDSTILLRLFEYDAQIALDNDGVLDGNVLTVTFPHTAVLYLRSTPETADRMTIRLVTPEGETAYSVPVVKMQSFSLEQIFEKKLFFLLPFYIFNREKELPE